MGKFNKLSRTEMRKVTGGTFSSCTAKCGKDANGKDITVTCTGDSCKAVDNDGCSSDTEHHSCGIIA